MYYILWDEDVKKYYGSFMWDDDKNDKIVETYYESDCKMADERVNQLNEEL